MFKAILSFFFLLFFMWTTHIYAASPDIDVLSIEETSKKAIEKPKPTKQIDPTVKQKNNQPIELPFPAPFGSQIFRGNFKDEQFTGFNPNYQIAVGDKITLKLWGVEKYEGDVEVDPQGNIFVPNVGPVSILGVRNDEINDIVRQHVQTVYKADVGSYASLQTTQPVKVFVTGNVTNPGLYGGLSFDSVLYYIDKAGGIDLNRGSYVEVDVLRNGQLRKSFNLYDFLLNGNLDLIQLSDGDTIFVAPRNETVDVMGDVFNQNKFEFSAANVTAADIIKIARPLPEATHFEIVHKKGKKKSSEYFEIAEAAQVKIKDGDTITVRSDKFADNIVVRVQGEHMGEHTLVLPYGATLESAMPSILPTSLSNMEGMQIYREEVKQRQKEMLSETLRKLEEQYYTARSATNEEADLRVKEAELITQFVEKASQYEPKGLVVLAENQKRSEVILQNNDIITIPKKSSVIMLHGEVMFPTAQQYSEDLDVDDYIEKSGGYTQQANDSKILVMKPNGSFETVSSGYDDIQPGDEIFVMPEVSTKYVEVTSSIIDVMYKVAVAAGVVLRL